MLGKTLQLTAAVTGTNNAAVNWSVNGIAGGSNAAGTISADGMFTAPSDLPSPANVQITAASAASPVIIATAMVTITSDIVLGVSSPAATVELGAQQDFAATLTSSGHPDPTIRWSLSGAACPGACGTIDANGTFTAPQILPGGANVTITAQSAADQSKQASVNVTITSHFTLQLTAPGTISTSTTALIVATMTPISGSHPSTIINWSLIGTGCSGIACGLLSTQTTNASDSTGDDRQSANYTAPGSAPTPNIVTIVAVPQADPTKKTQATIAVQPGSGLSLTPAAATVAANRRVTLSVQNGSANSSMNWSVSGMAGGSAMLGKICVVNSNPCSAILSSSASQVDYLAPGSLPSINPVTVQASSVADATKTAAAQITVLNHDVVTVLPNSVTVSPGAVQKFSASVVGSVNQAVFWQVQGSGCIVAGACGTIAADGTYIAPGTAPIPNVLNVVAVSSDDTAQSASAIVLILAGANIQSLHPASVYAGGANGFTLRVDGGGFRATTPGPGSSLLIGGNARTANCTSAAECTAPVFATDVAGPGNVLIQLQNPDGTLSNTVSLAVVAPNDRDANIPLTNTAPAATGVDVIVVDPTTAGVSIAGNNVDLDIAALGPFAIGSNTCTLAGNPVVLIRPASGAMTSDICIFSQEGLDTSMAYTVSGPNDVTVVAKQPAGLGIIHLTLQVQASAQTGARSLFIQNLNLDKTVASGVLEVQ